MAGNDVAGIANDIFGVPHLNHADVRIRGRSQPHIRVAGRIGRRRLADPTGAIAADDHQQVPGEVVGRRRRDRPGRAPVLSPALTWFTSVMDEGDPWML